MNISYVEQLEKENKELEYEITQVQKDIDDIENESIVNTVTGVDVGVLGGDSTIVDFTANTLSYDISSVNKNVDLEELFKKVDIIEKQLEEINVKNKSFIRKIIDFFKP